MYLIWKNHTVQIQSDNLYRKHFSPRWSLQAQAKYNHGWNKYKDEGKEYTDGYYRENHRQDEYYISATVLYRPLEALTLSLAQDGVINKLRNSLAEGFSNTMRLALRISLP